MPTVVPSMTVIPPFPATSDRATFTYNAKAFAFGNHMYSVFNAELLAVAENVFDNATEAEASASAASAFAVAADASATDAIAAKNLATTIANDLSLVVDLFLGSNTSDPATGNLGALLVSGNWYINSVSGFIRAYNGSYWVQGIGAIAGVSSVNGQVGAITVQPDLFFFTQGIV